jgi:hypothetical protein
LGKADETDRGRLFIPLTGKNVSSRSAEQMGGRGMAKTSLTPDQERIAARFGMSPLEFSSKKATLAAAGQGGKSAWGLTDQQREICHGTGMSEHRFAIAAGFVKGNSPGLMRAHSEIDRAHNALYDSQIDPPDRELLDLAMSELKAYDPDDDDTYDSLLKGVLYAATLLDRAAPAFVDSKDIE